MSLQPGRWWRACLAAAVLCVEISPAVARESPAPSPAALQSHAARARLTYEELTLPEDESLGLVGTSFMVDLDGEATARGSGWAIGPAVYGAIRGRRGGFYTVGGELAWSGWLSGPLGLELGLYVGGGGGGAAPQGGGLMLRPHADLLWRLAPNHAVGLSWSRVKFPSGRIDSTQVGMVWNVLTDFRFARERDIGALAQAYGRTGMGFDRVQAVAGQYRPRAGARRLSGEALSMRIGTVGIRGEQMLGPHAFWGLEAQGAGSGGVAGYAEYLGTLGVQWPLADGGRLQWGSRLALGMGGGGTVDTGGGLLGKASLFGTYQWSPAMALSLEAGVARAPQGQFSATFSALTLSWVIDEAQPAADVAPAVRQEFSAGVSRYDAARRDGRQESLQSVVLKVNRFIWPRVYLTGQVHSAMSGGAGGYSAGFLGAGLQAPLGEGWAASAELLAGAAGGGGVDTQGGFLVQPMAYLGYQWSPAVTVRVGGGRIKATQGPLNSGVLDLSVAFSWGAPAR